MWITDHPTHASTEWEVDDGGLPGRPHCERPHRVDRLLGVKSDSTPGRSTGIVVLDPEAVKNLDRPVVEPDRQRQPVLMSGVSQKRPGRCVEPHEIGQPIELIKCVGKRIEGGGIAHE
jgi:hypothetical protein